MIRIRQVDLQAGAMQFGSVFRVAEAALGLSDTADTAGDGRACGIEIGHIADRRCRVPGHVERSG